MAKCISAYILHMEEKQRNGIMIVKAFFELRRMTFSKTWVELIIWGIISKRSRYKWRVSTNISKHRDRQEKWIAALSKNFLLSWHQLKHSHCTRVLYISTGGRILDESLPLLIRVSLFICPDIRRNAPSSVWYITSESLDITRDSAIRFWTHAVSAGITYVFDKSPWLNIRRNTSSRLL